VVFPLLEPIYFCLVINKKNVMKTIAKILVLAAVLMGGPLARANGPIKNGVEKSIIHFDVEPIFVKRGQTVMMNLLNTSQGKVSLKVYDSEMRLVYNETVQGKLVVEKAFNFEKAYEDQYTIVVSDIHGTYREIVEVK